MKFLQHYLFNYFSFFLKPILHPTSTYSQKQKEPENFEPINYYLKQNFINSQTCNISKFTEFGFVLNAILIKRNIYRQILILSKKFSMFQLTYVIMILNWYRNNLSVQSPNQNINVLTKGGQVGRYLICKDWLPFKSILHSNLTTSAAHAAGSISGIRRLLRTI